MAACDVLVVGAGPTGLVLALWLTKLGAKVRIVDKSDAPGTTSRALAVQARTLELYRQLDLADAVVKRAHKVPAINFWARGKREVASRSKRSGRAGPAPLTSRSSRRTNTNACWSHGWRRRVFLSSVGPSWSNTRTRAIAL